MEKKETKEKKYIICDCAAQNHGKTETLLGLIDYFQSHFGYAPIPIIPIRAKRDRLFLFHLPNKDVVVDTYGDPYPIFLRWLNAAANTNAKIIFAACRTGRSQKNEVLKIAADYGYEVIWFSNFYWSNFNAMTASVLNVCRISHIRCKRITVESYGLTAVATVPRCRPSGLRGNGCGSQMKRRDLLLFINRLRACVR